jgi:hypothetical protein
VAGRCDPRARRKPTSLLGPATTTAMLSRHPCAVLSVTKETERGGDEGLLRLHLRRRRSKLRNDCRSPAVNSMMGSPAGEAKPQGGRRSPAQGQDRTGSGWAGPRSPGTSTNCSSSPSLEKGTNVPHRAHGS